METGFEGHQGSASDVLSLVRELAMATDGVEVLAGDALRLHAIRLRKPLPGRWVSCSSAEVADRVADELRPGILLTRDLGRPLLTFRERESGSEITVRGFVDPLTELMESVDFVGSHDVFVVSDRGDWRLRAERDGVLRIEGRLYTRFFPWGWMRQAGLFAALVSIAPVWMSIQLQQARLVSMVMSLPLLLIPGLIVGSLWLCLLLGLGPEGPQGRHGVAVLSQVFLVLLVSIPLSLLVMYLLSISWTALAGP